MSTIASLKLVGRREGDEFSIQLKIGAPYSAKHGGWACPVSLKPLFERVSDPHGADAFQALCLAISLAKALLRDFQRKGGVLLLENGQEFPFDSYGGWGNRD